MKPRHKKLLIIFGGLTVLGIATGLILNALRGNLAFFFTPTQVAAKEAPLGRSFRIGGLVEKGSLVREKDGLTVRFIVTDTVTAVPVVYFGILPDLFKEGKGVVAEGKIELSGIFRAKQVLAKHDENYMPPEAARALEQAKGSPRAAPTLKP